MKKIYLAGGCFWGVQEYFSRIPGVKSTKVGYANSKVDAPTYQQVCTGTTNAAETLYLEYDEKAVSLNEIMNYYFRIIDPVSINRQGADIGTQYRTGIYYTDSAELALINDYMDGVQKNYKQKLAVEVKAIDNFYDAEESYNFV